MSQAGIVIDPIEEEPYAVGLIKSEDKKVAPDAMTKLGWKNTDITNLKV